MKRIAIIAFFAAFLFGSVSCEKAIGPGEDDRKDNEYKPLEVTTKSAEFIREGNSFSFEFIDRINRYEEIKGDFIISPLSMQFLLGMVLNGAKGETADEISAVLGYGAGEVDAVNDYCLSMLKQLPELDKQTTLSIANAIVVNQEYSLLDSYKTTVSKHFEAEVSNLDFYDRKGSANKINKWCSDHTNGLIPEILDEVSPSMLAYLMNALYFKSEWASKFPKDNTATEPFKLENGGQKNVKMMKNKQQLLCNGNDVFTAVSLPYGNGAYDMMVILPDEGHTLKDVTQSLKSEAWPDFIKTATYCEVDIWLPKFETKSSIKMNSILSAMGMPTAFDEKNADFKAMSDDALCLSFVKQDAVIKVDEEGSEAAAISIAGVLATTAISPQNAFIFHADKPFLYLIYESGTGAILFAGRYNGQ